MSVLCIYTYVLLHIFVQKNKHIIRPYNMKIISNEGNKTTDTRNYTLVGTSLGLKKKYDKTVTVCLNDGGTPVLLYTM